MVKRALRVWVILFLVTQILFAQEKETKSLDATRAQGYEYLSSGEGSSALVQVGDKVAVTGVPVGALCSHGEFVWSKYLFFDPARGMLRTHRLSRILEGHIDGLCSDGKLLWALCGETKKLCALKLEHKGDASRFTVKVSKMLDVPGTAPGALTFAGSDFYVLDTAEKKIHVIDSSGQKKRDFPAPSATVTDVAYDGSYFWAVDRKRRAAYMFEEHGLVILYIALPFAPEGIECTQETIWISGLEERKTEEESEHRVLCRFKLNEKQKYTRRGSMEMDFSFSVKGPGKGYIAIPQNSNHQEVLTKIEFDKAAEVKQDNWKQRAARFDGKGTLKLRVRLHGLRYNVIPEQVGAFDKIPEELRKAYTIDGEMLKLTSKPVQEARDEVEKLIKKWKKKRTPYWVARLAYEYLNSKAHYERIPGWVDAPTLLTRGKGTCSPISFAYVAICRALGLPARFGAGSKYRGKDPSEDREFHRWCEVYLPNYGWVAADPSSAGYRGPNPTPLRSIGAWGSVPYNLVVMTLGGGGSDIFGWSYNGAGGRCVATWSNIKRHK